MPIIQMLSHPFKHQIPHQIHRLATWLGTRLKNNFYLYLAALFTVFILVDASVFHIGENMRQKAFDLVVRQRLIVPTPDPDIVILDVDEKSIAAMAKEYGRWPWPRQVFGEFLEKVQTHEPRAVVFDILFSDPDVQNPDSDAYLERAITASQNSYFPFLRLSPKDDGLSQIKPGMIKGMTPATPLTPGSASPHANIAVVLPNFPAALNSGRMGTINIDPDKDGTVRTYPLWRDDYGWRLPSLPLAVHQGLAQTTQEIPALLNNPQMLLNWRGKPYTYHYESFSDVFQDMAREHPTRPVKEFKNKIIILGSTAPSLADIKSTTMDRSFPGVEILATAIDNLKHQDYLGTWQGPLPYVLFSLVLLWLTAFAFYQSINRDTVNRAFSLGQIGLLVASYITINLLNWYLDVTGPLTWALLFFSVAKIYALLTDRALQRSWLRAMPANGKAIHLLALIPFSSADTPGESSTHLTANAPLDTLTRRNAPPPITPVKLEKVAKHIERIWQRQHKNIPLSISLLAGQQQQLWSLYTDVLLLQWAATVPDSALEINEPLQNTPTILIFLEALAQDKKIKLQQPLQYATHQFFLDATTSRLTQWRRELALLLGKL